MDWVDPGIFSVQVRLTGMGEHEKEILTALGATLEWAKKPGTEFAALLEKSRERLRNALITDWFSSPGHLSQALAQYTNMEPDLNVLNRINHSITSVSADEMIAFARKYFTDSGKTTVILRGKKQ